MIGLLPTDCMKQAIVSNDYKSLAHHAIGVPHNSIVGKGLSDAKLVEPIPPTSRINPLSLLKTLSACMITSWWPF